jgi:hypothetical protein
MEMPEDHVAMVSRDAAGNDAQPNATVRILDDDASTEADEAQLAVITTPEPADDDKDVS